LVRDSLPAASEVFAGLPDALPDDEGVRESIRGGATSLTNNAMSTDTGTAIRRAMTHASRWQGDAVRPR
jgi:hypothetical protein